MTTAPGGNWIVPGDPRYDTLVRGFNQRFVGNPTGVFVADSPEAVVIAVQQCLDARLRPVVRSGGHCYEGWSSVTDGMIIDVSMMHSAGFDDVAGAFYAESGCTNWDLANGLYRLYGVAIPGGSCYSVGAGGHISGGGYGLLSRLHGLTVDWLTGVELVTVRSGRAELIRVARDSPDADERDLFWAHTGGGGGNFGVITKYFFAELPAAPSWAWWETVAWNWSDLLANRPLFTQLVRNYGEFFAANSGRGSRYASLFALLHLRRVEGQQVILSVQQADDDPAPLDEFIDAVTDGIDPSLVPTVRATPGMVGHRMIQPQLEKRRMPWLEITQMENLSGPNQRGKYKSAYMNRPFPDDQIDTMWDWLTGNPASPGGNAQALVQVDSYGCAINELASDATAVAQRSSIMKLQYQTYWTDPAQDARNLAWIRGFYDAMYGPSGPRPDEVMDGCYVNYPDADLTDWEYLYYKGNYQRLQSTKKTWDPKNVFNFAQSIRLPS